MAALGTITACESMTAGSAIPRATTTATAAPAVPTTTMTTVVQQPQTVYVQPPAVRTYLPPADTAEGRTVTAYYDALNRGDFASAWSLGGRTLAGKSGYPTYVRGFATTAWVALTISDVTGSVARVVLSALQTDGSTRIFTGTYTVSGGLIVGSHMTRTT